ncbi:succinyl-CoA:glutarate CoA-transferase isoform X4 [Dermacentor andersoni]|uniref:succinyl-CoA:glutarate CoA-transferase isoform X4 n=1 Tax=Dermacentor andersoni TaxID=34620 RepID=UPI003B3A67BE
MSLRATKCRSNAVVRTLRKNFHDVHAAHTYTSIRELYAASSTGRPEDPLKGVRVLDLTRILAGPYCSMILGDLGAEIIKIERPGVGDETRNWGPPFLGNQSCYFLSVNRNKKVMDRRDHTGSVQAMMSSLPLWEVFYTSQDPMEVNHAKSVLLSQTWQLACMPTALSWLHFCSEIAQVSVLANIASNYLNANLEASRHGTSHESIVPYAAFETLDGYITVGAASEGQFKVFCRVLDVNELLSDPRFKDNPSRVQNRDALVEILNKKFKLKTTKEWLQLFEGSGIPYGPINTIQQVFQDPQGKEMVVKLPHKTAGTVSLVGPAVEFSDGMNQVRSPPPLLGEHTDEVLSEYLTADEIARLRAKKVIA